MTRKKLWQACFLVAALAFPATGAHADEVRVLAAGAAKHALEEIAPAFERASGHTLRAGYDTVGTQRDRVLQAAPGAVADLVVLSDAALQQLRVADRLQPRAAVGIGRVVVALAAPAGTSPLPDISDAAHLRAALQAAPSIAYADPARGATAGTHFAKVLDALDLRAELAPRLTVLPFGVDVINAVAAGKFALGVSQSSEIMAAQGVRFVGGLPAPHAQATGYGAALASGSGAAVALLEFLATPAAQSAWRASGFTAP
ncbi:substrate-binding domain-containing protein [Ramlibacter sp. XY19]|uniref:molybdate ABC transporter substrate-binding protein n=1 Tax=Ramlibacter paludis TaxID=2908000 RepID=UPI0023D9DA60|nr:substrate-binding domain-containing protein [Ramlibacter paludis]MCG2591950.1 substrate-binding domain-containing protein [Ramlibacter paludis]